MNIPTVLPKLLKVLLALVACNIVLLFIFNHIETGQFPRLYVVQSGSMQPAMATGDLIFTFPNAQYRPGDIITFLDTDRDLVVTHRVTETTTTGQTVTYQTKGDANESPDTNRVAHENVYGKMMLRLPYAGYMSSFIQTVPGFMLFVIIPALIIIAHETKTIAITINQLRVGKEQR